MSLKKMMDDLNIIQKLDDEPNDVGGLSAAELKKKFDEGPLAIQTYINERLIPALESMGIGGGTPNLDEAILKNSEAIKELQAQGNVRYDTEQELTEENKATARSNMGAVSSEDVTTAINTALGDYASALSALDRVIGR